MAKLTGPLLSLGAKGQIGKTLVASSWRGIATARQYVVPANPRSTAQQDNRTRFSFLQSLWKFLPSAALTAYDTYSKGRKFTAVNAFVQQNLPLIQAEVDLQALVLSPGTGGAFAPSAVSAATGTVAGSIDVTVTPSADIPDTWTVVRCHVVALVDQEPTAAYSGPVGYGNDATDPYVITITGMGAGAACVAYGFIEYTKPNGQTAYSVSLMDTATADT